MRGSKTKGMRIAGGVLISMLMLSGAGLRAEDVSMEVAGSIAARYMEARNSVAYDLLGEVYADDVLIHDCSKPDDIEGLAALKTIYASTQKIFPDLWFVFDEIKVSGEEVIYLWTITGTNTGSLKGGLPPTGKAVKFSGVAICRIEEGKIAEEWIYFNPLVYLEQLGFTLMPPGK